MAAGVALAATPAWAASTERVSVGLNGAVANGYSSEAAISADGRFVAFSSYASNLVAGDTNFAGDIFVRDLKTGATTRANLTTDGAQSQGQQDSHDPALSTDGRFVVFGVSDTNLVPDDTNHWPDIFVRDRKLGTTARVSIGQAGNQGNSKSYNAAISGDGRLVAFDSFASNLVPGDTKGVNDVFIHDRSTAKTTRQSLGPKALEANKSSGQPAISTNGRFVAFSSSATNLTPGDTNGAKDIFVRDRNSDTTSRVSLGPKGKQANGDSWAPAISKDGRYVAFKSAATNLVSGDTNTAIDVFVHDRKTGTTTRVNVGPKGVQDNAGTGTTNDGSSGRPALSADGRYVAFDSYGSNLVTGDSNGSGDVFVRDRKTGTTSRVSVQANGSQSAVGGLAPSISANGKIVSFVADRDIYVRTH